MSEVLSVILAAGKGTRMKSDTIKVLHTVAGVPMIKHVVENVSEFCSDIVVVIGHQGEKVSNTFNETEKINFVTQEKQLGTGHAVIQAKEYIKDFDGTVLVLYGDTPLLKCSTLRELVRKHENAEAACTVLTAIVDNPQGYGRIVRTGNQSINKIVEEKDADQDEKTIKEINSGVCCFNSKMLLEALENLDNDNVQGEYYLTDTIGYLSRKGHVIMPLVVDDNNDIIGINDRVNLAKAEKIMRQRINKKHMDNGVTIIDPDTTYIDSQVKIGYDTIIYPFTYIEGKSIIGDHCVVGSHSRIVSGLVGNYVNIKDHSIIIESDIANQVNVGPFAYIRPGCSIADEVKIGDFVELKKAAIGKGTKVPHLSYVGDAKIGEGTNIGAGTIFANYDGKEKHRTRVGNNVFIGSNTTLIAPVKVNDKGKTGAGSVVTKDVDKGITVVGVPAKRFAKNTGGKGEY
ncbi:MAG: bifunctional UDP-N-acetylglucosamine diphosphorylase/glucosamine-1-phosphate N-acetyltransferase GlmU [Bacillota bacterium]